MRREVLIISVATAILFLFAFIATVESSSSFSTTVQYPLHKSEINITSNTTIYLYVNAWVTNNTSLSFTGKLVEVPGYNGVGNATLNISWNNSKIGEVVTTLSPDLAINGTFGFNFTVTEIANSYPLNVSFAGDAYRNASWNETLIIVKHSVVISASVPEKVVVGENLSAVGIIRDDDGSTLGNETLELYFDGSFTGSTTVTNGTGFFSFNYTIPPITTAEEHYVNISHPESEYYCQGDSEVLEVSVKRKTRIDLESKSVGRNTTVNITGILVDNMNLPLGDKKIHVYWQNLTGTHLLGNTTTNQTGCFSINHSVEDPLGNVTVIANFEGSFYYEPGSGNATYIVRRGANIILDSKRAVRNNTVNITGRLLDDEGKSMANANLSLYWQGNWVGNATTNYTGNFSKPYTIPIEHKLGNASITAVLEENKTFARSETAVNYTIYAETSIQINSKNLTRGEFVDIAGRLVDDVGDGVVGVVEILWSNRSISNITSGNDGNFSFRYQVPWNHSLGWVNITAKFAGTEIYNESFGTTQYLIYSKTNISMSGMQVFRNISVVISGNIEDDLYAGVPNLSLEIYWHNNTGKYLLNITKSNNSGYFSVFHTIPRNHSLGSLNMSAVFNGTEIYAKSEIAMIYTVVSNTTIVLEPKEKLFKCSEIEIAGLLLDDMGTNIENHTVLIYWNNISIGTASSTSAGFILPYLISENQSVGAGGVRALFPGSSIYIHSENNITYYIYSNTTLNGTLFGGIVIDEEFRLQIQLFENCTGAQSTPVPNEYVCIGINNLSLGIGITNADGMFNFTVHMPLNVPLGLNVLTAKFNGSLYYEPAYYEVPVIVKQRANLILNIPTTIEEKKEIKCTLSLIPKSHNLPIEIKFTLVNSTENVSIIIEMGEGKFNLFPDANSTAVVKLLTDFQGNITFSVFTSFTGVMKIDAEFKGGEYITGANTSGVVCIYEKTVKKQFQWFYLLFIPLLCMPFAGYYIMRKYQIAKMRKIIQEAKGELIAGTEYIKTILVLYRKLCTHLKKFGFLRKEFETFREFETAVRSALPIDEESLGKFISIIEEVRYSAHEIGEEHKKKAIDNFSTVERDIKKLESERK